MDTLYLIITVIIVVGLVAYYLNQKKKGGTAVPQGPEVGGGETPPTS